MVRDGFDPLRPVWWQRLTRSDSDLLWVRFLLLRLLGVVYLTAFLVAALQAVPLIGERGLLPVPDFMARVLEVTGGRGPAALKVPTLFWLGYSDAVLQMTAWLGVGLSLVVIAGATNAALQFVLWLLYLSIVEVGQRFYGYGWESQLLETGFLAIFLCPLRSVRPDAAGVPWITVLLFRWLAFRIYLGAGLIKIRGDECWRDLSCLLWHYETQPIPNPLTPLFHFAPAWLNRAGVLVNHVVELVAPFAAFGPRRLRLAAGVAFIAFQLTLIVSGNLSFLNWLTIVPAIACFDDRALRAIVPSRVRGLLSLPVLPCSRWQLAAAFSYACVVTLLSVQPVLNLLSPNQAMNTSFDPLRLVNTYGAFGSVGKERYEVVLEGTSAPELGPQTRFQAYEFPCKPGDVRRRPCWISPYHLRLDWQMWFAALGNAQREPWIVHLVYQLLSGDEDITRLLAHDPFAGRPPRFIRAEFYRYSLAPPFSGDGVWWTRTRVGSYLPPLSLDDARLMRFMREHGFRTH